MFLSTLCIRAEETSEFPWCSIIKVYPIQSLIHTKSVTHVCHALSHLSLTSHSELCIVMECMRALLETSEALVVHMTVLCCAHALETGTSASGSVGKIFGNSSEFPVVWFVYGHGCYGTITSSLLLEVGAGCVCRFTDRSAGCDSLCMRAAPAVIPLLFQSAHSHPPAQHCLFISSFWTNRFADMIHISNHTCYKALLAVRADVDTCVKLFLNTVHPVAASTGKSESLGPSEHPHIDSKLCLIQLIFSLLSAAECVRLSIPQNRWKLWSHPDPNSSFSSCCCSVVNLHAWNQKIYGQKTWRNFYFQVLLHFSKRRSLNLNYQCVFN